MPAAPRVLGRPAGPAGDADAPEPAAPERPRAAGGRAGTQTSIQPGEDCPRARSESLLSVQSISSVADGRGALEGAARRWGARLALLALAAAALGGPTARHEEFRRSTCSWREQCGNGGWLFANPLEVWGADPETASAWGESFCYVGWWGVWPLYFVGAPACLAFVAWCVAARGSFRAGVPEHAWTRRYAGCMLLHAAAVLALPGLHPDCYWKMAEEEVGMGNTHVTYAWLVDRPEAASSVAYATSFAAWCVRWYLLVLRLRLLGCKRRAAVAHAFLLAGAAGAAGAAATILASSPLDHLAIGAEGYDTAEAEALWTRLHDLRRANLVCILLLLVCQTVGFCCGVWGLLASAARLKGRAASWVRATALVTLVALLLSWVEWVLIIDDVHGVLQHSSEQDYTPSELGVVESSSLDEWSDIWNEKGKMPWRWSCPLWYIFRMNYRRSWAWVCTIIFNCLSVATLSGLFGTHAMQILAKSAFRQINVYSADQLQDFYEEYLAYLDEARVQWVYCRFLRQLARAGATMVRCQDVPRSEAPIGREGFPLARDDPKHRFVVSHPWLSAAHPDPEGVKLRALVEQLDLLGASDEDAVFVDYMGLPQPKPGEHPALRSQEEEALFQKALGSMELIYSMGRTPVIVLPMDDSEEYISRGWCFFEFGLAHSFDNIANAEHHAPVKELIEKAKQEKWDTVDGFDDEFTKTHFTCKADKPVVRRLFKNTLTKKSKKKPNP